ncbi:YXWGXW repeat-containing protein [Xanthomonas campestris pv. cannae]|nr:YXWGXW repeat-containing protein [Xanthomonas campestris pv. cannae]
MFARPLLLATLLGGALVGGMAAAPAHAREVVELSVRAAPPPPIVERVVVRPGYVWMPGYWRWNGHRHVWVAGRYVVERPGYVYVGPRWEHYGPAYRFHAGYWARH